MILSVVQVSFFLTVMEAARHFKWFKNVLVSFGRHDRRKPRVMLTNQFYASDTSLPLVWAFYSVEMFRSNFMHLEETLTFVLLEKCVQSKTKIKILKRFENEYKRNKLFFWVVET